ncbi:MAG: hypothetical protein ACSHYB_11540 [Roseibacillus sp.]
MKTTRLLSYLTAIFVLLAAGSTQAQMNRGVWFWGSTSTPDGPSPYGSIDVVGDSVKEDESIAFFNTHGVKRIYGSYQNRPVSDTLAIAEWNQKLEYAFIESQLLLDFVNIHDAVAVDDFMDKIQERFIDYNASYYDLPQYRFDALHLDIEPQGSAPWDAADAAGKRAILEELKDLYADIRALLVAEGVGTIPVYADIPFTWDKLPVDGGSVGWVDAADRDAWFAGIGDSLDGISIMTFSKDTVSELTVATEYERTGAFPGFARIGIQPKGWPGQQWESIWEVNSILTDLEAIHAPNHATDLENYGFWRYSIEDSLLVPVIVDIDIVIYGDDPGTGPGTPFPGGGTGPAIYFDGVAGYVYTVKHASRLNGQWREMEQVKARDGNGERLRVPIDLSQPAGFFKVEVCAEEVER